jgi:uncharacterized membrane protein YGL010W
MTGIQQLLDEYGVSHQHPTNKLIHWFCVPLIVWSLLAMIWSFTIPAFFASLPFELNWALVLIILSMIYYFLVSISLAVGILLVFILMVTITWWINLMGIPTWQVALPVFVLAWIGQFIGHKIEGKRPSFFKDIQFLLIGPLWLLSFVYRKLGIRY